MSNKRSNKRSREKRVLFVKWIKEMGCIRCSSLKNLTLHHRDPREKTSDVYDAVKKSWGALIAEVLKCEVLCRECHNFEHGGPSAGEGSYKALKEYLEFKEEFFSYREDPFAGIMNEHRATE